MRALTSSEIKRISTLTENSVELTLIEPTKNGLEKSIMDATGAVRTFLKEKRIHDYQLQKQGPENKIVVDAYIVIEDKFIQSVASMYRPITKKGDPRIWFKQLRNYANPNDILGIIAQENKLFVINLTKIDVDSLIKGISNNPLKEFLTNVETVQYNL